MELRTKITLGLAIAGFALVLLLKPKNVWADSKRVLVLGDSMVSSPGFLSALREGFGPGVAVKLVSLPGKGTGPIKEAGLEAAHSWGPDLVIVLAGVNDLASGRGWLHAAENLEDLYRGLDDMGIHVAAVRLTPWETHRRGRLLQAETAKLNDWISRQGIPVAVAYTESVDQQGKDGLHLSTEGGRQLADAVLYALEM